jgi:hypothetical protein
MRRRLGPALIAAAAFSLVLSSFAFAERIEVTLISVTSPVSRGHDATIAVRTSPGARCLIGVQYKSGSSHAKGLGPQNAGRSGQVSWTWRVGTATTPGTWPISVICSTGEQQATLDTSFTVR